MTETTDTIPAEARARFPDLNLDDPATWPEPARCTDGAPFGPSAYGSTGGPSAWQHYLRTLGDEAAGRKVWNGRCRNRGRFDHLCGTHDKVRARRREEAERSARIKAAAERGLAIAHELDRLGIESDARGAGVQLSEDQANRLADRLTADRDALNDLAGAAEALLRQNYSGTVEGLRDAVDRIRRHLSR